MKILLIEDDRDYAETLIDIFSVNQNHDLLWLEKLLDIKRAINNKIWDIILCDIHLDFHPDMILELYKKSGINHKTPLIFLTAERETKLSFDIIEKGDFPVVSKFEIDKDVLSVIRNYTDLFKLINKQVDEDEQVSFRKYFARYINEKRYENSEFSRSLSGWIDQEKFIFSKLKAENRVYKNKKKQTPTSSLRAGYLKIGKKDFRILEFSPSVESLVEHGNLKGVPLYHVLNKIIDTEKLYGVLHRVLESKDGERTEITLPGIGSKGTIQYDIFIKTNYVDDEYKKNLDIEIIQNRDREVEKAELFNIKQTNKILLQEVHHRVNNNLNVINSLLNLSLINAKGEEAEIYQTVLNKITPISTVYEQLYSSKKIALVNLKDYLNDLSRKIFGNKHHSILKVIVEDKKLQLNLNQVISLGLMLNEMYQKFKERDLNVALFVQEQFDIINLVFKAENISSILDDQDNAIEQQGEFIFNALLNKLGALISVSGKDKIVIRFKKVTKRGSGSNLSD